MFQKQSPCGLYRRHLKEGANGVIVKKGCVVIPAINNRFSIQGKRPSKQQGATLIEVMVAIFVLAFGVLALMVAQLRSVSSVQEAENQTVVAQAAQTLMEGMLVNPVVSVVGGSTNKDYAVYAQGDVLALCPIDADGDYPDDNSVIDKATLAQRQLCRFSTDLQTKLPNLTNLNAEVCRVIRKTARVIKHPISILLLFHGECRRVMPRVRRKVWPMPMVWLLTVMCCRCKID